MLLLVLLELALSNIVGISKDPVRSQVRCRHLQNPLPSFRANETCTLLLSITYIHSSVCESGVNNYPTS